MSQYKVTFTPPLKVVYRTGSYPVSRASGLTDASTPEQARNKVARGLVANATIVEWRDPVYDRMKQYQLPAQLTVFLGSVKHNAQYVKCELQECQVSKAQELIEQLLQEVSEDDIAAIRTAAKSAFPTLNQYVGIVRSDVRYDDNNEPVGLVFWIDGQKSEHYALDVVRSIKSKLGIKYDITVPKYYAPHKYWEFYVAQRGMKATHRNV